MDTEKNKERFEALVAKVNREGMDELMDYVRNKSDFYTAPASARFHLCCEGGLLQHSLNVYDCLVAKKQNPIWKPILDEISEESLIIMALFHDLCKTNFYKKGYKNQKTYDSKKVDAAESWERKHDNGGYYIWETVETYTIEDEYPLGHGEKSVLMLDRYIKLKKEELYAIRWHMGFTEEKSQYNTLDKAMEKYPIVLAFNEADMEASKLLEREIELKPGITMGKSNLI